jgi:hypothetical protein
MLTGSKRRGIESFSPEPGRGSFFPPNIQDIRLDDKEKTTSHAVKTLLPEVYTLEKA